MTNYHPSDEYKLLLKMFGKKSIENLGNLNTSSTKIYYNLVKYYKKQYEFSTQFQYNFDTNTGGVI